MHFRNAYARYHHQRQVIRPCQSLLTWHCHLVEGCGCYYGCWWYRSSPKLCCGARSVVVGHFWVCCSIFDGWAGTRNFVRTLRCLRAMNCLQRHLCSGSPLQWHPLLMSVYWQRKRNIDCHLNVPRPANVLVPFQDHLCR